MGRPLTSPARASLEPYRSRLRIGARSSERALELICFAMRLIPTSILLVSLLAMKAAAQSVDPSVSEMRFPLERFQADLSVLSRKYTVPLSRAQHDRMVGFYKESLDSLEKLPFDSMSHPGQVDFLLFKNHLQHALKRLSQEQIKEDEMQPILPFAQTIVKIEEAWQAMETPQPQQTATTLNDLAKGIQAAKHSVDKGLKVDRVVANRAVLTLQRIRSSINDWFNFYNGYDPLFSWWVSEPFKEVNKALEEYTNDVRDKLVGIKPDDKTTIIGDPIGDKALKEELEDAMIPYSPSEIIEIANKEFAWCEVEMKKASHELGYGDDWKKALEHTKQQYVEPGKQPELIRSLAEEAAKFVMDRDLVTVPPLAIEGYRMSMMSPDRQLVNPFFLGGEEIQVSYPTDTMTHDQKMMSMRGNNRHFARATVHHELIPGHHLQGYMQERYRPYRQLFYTPFWVEGWALYWEMLLWDLNFAKSPEDKVGMLFWRMHRCARIIFSLSFHTGKMTPQQCVDFLVDRVGHERDNAAAEVRRSFGGSYEPLYQAAYMLGGLQIRSLRHELVSTGKMTDKQFHDAILHENSIPIEMVRASLESLPLKKDQTSSWRFYDKP